MSALERAVESFVTACTEAFTLAERDAAPDSVFARARDALGAGYVVTATETMREQVERALTDARNLVARAVLGAPAAQLLVDAVVADVMRDIIRRSGIEA